MKLLFVISTLNTGGAQRVLSNLVTNLPDDWEIDILLNSTDNIIYPYRGNLIDLGFDIPSNPGSIIYQLRVFSKRLSALQKSKRTNSYDACISFLESANIVNVLSGKKHCKTILTVHCTLSRNKSLTYRCINSVIRHFYNRADHVVAVSKGVEYDLVRNLGVQEAVVTTIWNGFPLESIKSQAGKRSKAQLFTFITVGRCDQSKSQWHLLRAFAKLVRNHNDCRLTVLGDGICMEYLKLLAANYRIEENVSFKGFVNNPFIDLVNADVFVLSSLHEGFGNVIIEAMACSLPVIATDFRSGAREILAPDTDIDFEQKSEVELAEFGIITPVCSGIKYNANEPLEPQEQLLLEAMELIYTDTTLRERYAKASKQRAHDFSIEKCVEQWRTLLENL